MEEDFEFEGFPVNQMELLLESDEEEASLIEEMEKQAVNVSPSMPEKVSKQDLDISDSLTLEVEKGAQDISENLAQKLKREAENVADSLAQELEREAGGTGYTLGYKNTNCTNYLKKLSLDMANLPEDILSYLESNESGATFSDLLHSSVTEQDSFDDSGAGDIDILHKKMLHAALGSGDMVTPDLKAEENNESVGTLDGVQILQLNMSAEDLILAKSAAAFKFNNKWSTSDKLQTYEKLQRLSALLDTSKGFLEACDEEEPSFSERERMMLRRILEPKKRKKTSKPPSRRRKTTSAKSITEPVGANECSNKKKVSAKQSKKKTTNALEKHKRLLDETSSSQAKKAKSCSNSKPLITFHCSFCPFRCPFAKENIETIVEHLTPSERYNQLFHAPPKMMNFKESVKLSAMVAKNKSKAQIRFLNRLECNNCQLHFPLNVENSDQIVIHYYCCLRQYSGAKTLSCLFCNKEIARGSIRKHLSHQCRKHCPANIPSTLQMMSCVCRNYTEDHKPVCVVCNEKCWPYIGHRAELDPVCEPCRLNIISGNTTELLVRDVTGCAICSKYCSKKFVTYWASELESLFIGEHCIEKLKEPNPELSEEMISLKRTKMEKLVELVANAVSKVDDVEMLGLKFGGILAAEAGNENESTGDSSELRLSTNISQSDNDKDTSISPAVWDEPLPRVAVNFNHGQVNGSYKIFGSNMALPFTTITTAASNKHMEDEVPTTYAVLIPKAGKKKMQKAVKNDLGILENNFKPGEFPLTESSLVSCAQKLASQAKPKRPPSTSKNSKSMKRLRIEGGGNIFTDVSRVNDKDEVPVIKVNTSTPIPQIVTTNMDSESFSGLNTVKVDGGKFIIKFASCSNEFKSTQNKKATDGNDSRIVIKTKSTTSQPEINNIAPPRIAHVIRTQSSVINNRWVKKEKAIYIPPSPRKTLYPIAIK